MLGTLLSIGGPDSLKTLASAAGHGGFAHEALFEVIIVAATTLVMGAVTLVIMRSVLPEAFEKLWHPVADKVIKASEDIHKDIEITSRFTREQVEETAHIVRAECQKIVDGLRTGGFDLPTAPGSGLRGGAAEITGAMKSVNQRANDRPVSPDLAEARAMVKEGSRDGREKARTLYAKVLTEEPRDPTVHIEYASLLIDAGSYAEALDIAGRGMQLGNSDLRLTHNYGVALYHSDRFDEAIGQLQKCASQNHPDPRTYQIMGMALWKKDQFEEAIEATRVGTQYAQQMEDTQMRVKCLQNTSYYLFEIARKAIGGDPVRSRMIQNESSMEAARLVDELFAILQPEQIIPNYHDTRGCVRLWRGDYHGAREDFTAAMDMWKSKMGSYKELYVQHLGWADELLRRERVASRN